MSFCSSSIFSSSALSLSCSSVDDITDDENIAAESMAPTTSPLPIKPVFFKHSVTQTAAPPAEAAALLARPAMAAATFSRSPSAMQLRKSPHWIDFGATLCCPFLFTWSHTTRQISVISFFEVGRPSSLKQRRSSCLSTVCE